MGIDPGFNSPLTAVGGPDNKKEAVNIELRHRHWTHLCKFDSRQQQLEHWKRQPPPQPAAQGTRNPRSKETGANKVCTNIAVWRALLSVAQLT